MEGLREQVALYHERTKHIEKIELLKRKRCWIEYSDAKDIFEEKKAALDRIIKELKLAEQAIQPSKDELAVAECDYENMQAELQAYSIDFEAKKRAAATVMQSIQSLQGEIKDADFRLENLKQQEANRKSKISDLESELLTIDEKLKNPPDVDTTEIDAELRDFNKSKIQLEQRLDAINGKKLEIQKQGHNLNRVINARNEELSKMESTRHKKLEFLRRYEPHSFEARQFLNENRALFASHVFEPICLELIIKDPESASIIESSLSRQALTSFVFTDEVDYNTFLSEVADNRKLHVNAILVKQRLSSFKSPMSQEEIRRYGFEGYFLDAVTAPEPILVALCDSFKVHLLPISKTAVDFKRVDESSGIRKYCAGGFSYEVSRDSRDNSVTAVISRSLKPARFFSLSSGDAFSKELKDSLLKEIHEARDSLKRNGNIMNQLITEERKIDEQLSSLLDEIKASFEKKAHAKRELVAFSKLQNLKSLKMDELEALLAQKSIGQQEQELHARKSKLLLQVPGLFKEHVDLISTTILEVHKQKMAKTIDSLFSQAKISILKDKISAMEESLEQYHLDFTRADSEFQKAKSFAKLLLTKAKNSGPIEELKAAMDVLPNTLLEIDDMIEQESIQSELKHSISPKVVEEHQEKERVLELLSAEIMALQTTSDSIKQSMRESQERWVPKVEALIGMINEKFSDFFKFMHYSGQVSLMKSEPPEDYDKWGIEILVKFRNEEPLHRLTSERQSGGERSVSTILYLMALQELAIAPFRVVDEINQGMDPRNERLVHQLIVQTSTLPETCQCFLITPKLLTDLFYNEKVKIHVVQNAEYNITSPEFRSVYQRLLSVK